jgi:S-DNA-T family DNA segregation ATPase FtsK/SpoIIIE
LYQIFLANALYGLFGYLSYALPLGMAYLAWVILDDHRALRTVDKSMLALRSAGWVLVVLGGSGSEFMLGAKIWV